ncbi:MAG: hypothetical protein ACO1RT_00420 [Planctomycetaceae bacterium]
MENSDTDTNPYAASLSVPSSKPDSEERSLWKHAIAGARWSLISTFPITFLMALLFRFPVPFAGIGNGPAHALASLVSLFFYGVLMGGFVVVGLFGWLAGIVAYFLTDDPPKRRNLQRALSIAVSFVLLFILATLDWYIGPW